YSAPIYLLSRFLGLNRRKAAATVTIAEALWPILPYAASESWATVTFTVTLAMFVMASLDGDRRDLALLFLATLEYSSYVLICWPLPGVERSVSSTSVIIVAGLLLHECGLIKVK
ncbi:MAG: hypothetical protein ACP5HK_07495, partial [Acidilobus sp.]